MVYSNSFKIRELIVAAFSSAPVLSRSLRVETDEIEGCKSIAEHFQLGWSQQD